MNRNGPLVSICMVVYNGEKTISQTLDSLLAQDYSNFELIILDNQSSDSTPQICRAYAEKDSRIRYIVDDIRVPALDACNRIIKYVRGIYYMSVCDDDVYEPSYISKLVSILESDKEIGLAYSLLGYIDMFGNKVRCDRFTSFKPRRTRFLNFLTYMIERNPLILFGVMRTSVQKELLPYVRIDQTDWNWDNTFVLRLLARYKVECAEETLFYWRIKDRSFQFPRDWPKEKWQQTIYRLKHQAKVTLVILDIINRSPFSYLQKIILKLFASVYYLYLSLMILDPSDKYMKKFHRTVGRFLRFLRYK